MTQSIGPSDMRASDADREQAIAHLQACTADGRLALDEFTSRADAACKSKTLGELEPLLADLPPIRGTAPSREIEELTPKASSIKRNGNWIVPRKLVVRSLASNVILDCSAAQLPHHEVDIELDTQMSGITIILPRDAWASDDVSVHASSISNNARNDRQQDGVRFVVHGQATASGVVIRRLHRFLWWSF